MLNRYPLISIVMLNYNGLKYLKRTIPPILKLDYPNYEFIIVDNGSTDGSIEFIKKFKKIKLIENGENLGYSKGKNIGVKHAKGEYILLLDNDILIGEKGLLIILLEFYKSKKNIGFASIPLIDSKSKGTTRYGCYYSFYGQTQNKPIKLGLLKELEKYFESPAPIGGDIFFKKSIWLKVGGYDESYLFNIDDYDIGARSILQGFKNYILNTKPFLHLGMDERINNKRWSWKYRYYFCGFGAVITKNYSNPLKYLFYFNFFVLLKTIKNTFTRLTLRPLFSLIYSYYLFIKNLPNTLKQRKIIQSKRVINEDIFLKIKPPKII